MLGLDRGAMQLRLYRARREGLHADGVPTAPPRVDRRKKRPLDEWDDYFTQPVETRDRLTLVEAMAYTGRGRRSIFEWRQAGLLPNTIALNRNRKFYLRADLALAVTAGRHRGLHALAERRNAAALEPEKTKRKRKPR